MAGVLKTEPHLVKNRDVCSHESEQDIHVSTISTPMMKTVQEQAAHETLPPVTYARTVQGSTIFYPFPAVKYHVEMK